MGIFNCDTLSYIKQKGDFMFNEELEYRALKFATKAHYGVYRKDKVTPYIMHPKACAEMLNDFSSEVYAAALLHDVIEDTSFTFEDLEKEFGPTVAQFVNEVTEQDKSLPWEERKKRYLQHLSNASLEATAIAFADKIDNMQSLRQQITFEGPEVLKSFNASADRIIWYHQEVLNVGCNHLGQYRDTHPSFRYAVSLITRYRIELDKFQGILKSHIST